LFCGCTLQTHLLQSINIPLPKIYAIPSALQKIAPDLDRTSKPISQKKLSLAQISPNPQQHSTVITNITETTMEQTEAELERFRQQWREEVSAKRGNQSKAPNTQATSSKAGKQPQNQPPTARRRSSQHDGSDDTVPNYNIEIKEREHGRKFGDEDYGSASRRPEPKTALEHYEKAVEKEGQGAMGDSVSLYRKAFRMDQNVHEIYKRKHYPPSSFSAPKPTNPNPSNAPATVPNTAHHSLTGLAPTVSDLIADFSNLKILGQLPPTEFSPPPPCPIAGIPEEILSQILLNLAIQDVASLARVAQVCKRLAYLVLTEDSIWKRVVHGHEFGLAAMHYTYACTILGSAISEHSIDDSNTEYTLDESPTVNTQQAEVQTLPTSTIYPTYRHMFRQRPRVRFNGCYISTVNYQRPGGAHNTLNWNAPVLIVTYYRYLRFFRDGSLISLLTTSEPSDVVPYLQKEHVHRNHSGGLPEKVMKDALPGRWRLSGNPYAALKDHEGGQDGEEESEGDVIIETEGVVPKYMYKMHLTFGSAGTRARNNKLAWKGFWSWNRLSDDWAEFGLRNDKPFYWSRVRSFGTGL
jgi:F-box protein 9